MTVGSIQDNEGAAESGAQRRAHRGPADVRRSFDRSTSRLTGCSLKLDALYIGQSPSLFIF